MYNYSDLYTDVANSLLFWLAFMIHSSSLRSGRLSTDWSSIISSLNYYYFAYYYDSSFHFTVWRRRRILEELAGERPVSKLISEAAKRGYSLSPSILEVVVSDFRRLLYFLFFGGTTELAIVF